MTTHFLKFIFCTVIVIILDVSIARDKINSDTDIAPSVSTTKPKFSFAEYQKSHLNGSNNPKANVLASLESMFANRVKLQKEVEEDKENKEDKEDVIGSLNSFFAKRENSAGKNKALEMAMRSRQMVADSSEAKKNKAFEMAMRSRQMLEINNASQGKVPEELPIQKIEFKEAQKWIQKEFEKVSTSYGIDESAKVINLYLLGNYVEFSDCLKRSLSVAQKLDSRGKLAFEKLKQEIKVLENNYKFNNKAFSLLCDFSNSYETHLLANVEKLLNLIKKLIQKETFGKQAKNDRSSVTTLKNETETLVRDSRKFLIKYHKTLMTNENALNEIAHSSQASYFALKELEIISEKFFTILNSLDELSKLVNAAEKNVITEEEAKKTLKLISLRSSIFRRLQSLSEDDGEITQSEVKLPTDVIISEKEYLSDALNYIDKFIENPAVGLDDFLKIKELLKHPLTTVNGNQTQGDPSFMIMNFDDTVSTCAKVVFGLLKDRKYDICSKIYSFVGNDISESDTKYGGCLSSTAYRMLDRNYAWYSANYVSDYMRKIEKKFIKTPEIVNSYILFSDCYKNINSVLSTAVKNRLKSMFKLSMDSYYVDIRERLGNRDAAQNEQKEQSLIKFVLNGVELGSAKDQKQIANSVVIRTLEKVSRKIVANFSLMLNEFENDIAKIMENRKAFSKGVSADELSNLINNKFNEFISSNPVFKIDDSQGNKIQFIFNVQKNTISEDDIKNMLYVMAKNSEKVKSSSLHIVGGKSSDNVWILEVCDELRQCIAKSIEKIDGLLGSENENIICENFKKFLNS